MYPVVQFCASMLRPSCRIGRTELHEGAIFFDIVRFPDSLRAIYMSTCEKITRTKSHVYLELSAKRASICTYITCMHGKTHVRLYLFTKDTACTRKKIHLDLPLDLSAKDTAIELMYINMHVLIYFWNCI